MSQEHGDNEGRGGRIIGLILLMIVLLAIGAYVLLFMGKGPGTSGLPPIDIPTSAVGQQGALPGLPSAPTVLGADVVAVYDVPVSWADNSDNEDGFNIYRQRTDVAGDQVKAGSSGENLTSFLDQDTYCGETYHYTISSFNAAGESPATVCWEITLPPCPKDETLDLQPGPGQGYNFLTGGVSANSDFYLPPVGQPRSFMADQAGQGGLIDLGDTGDTPLHHVNLPQPSNYQRGGVPAVAGHTYAALATDKQSVIVFKVTKLGDDAVFNYIVWRPEKAINGQCAGQTSSQPGGTCKCDQNGSLVCSNGRTIQKDPRCTNGQPECECQTLNFGSQSVGFLVCKYPDGHTTSDPAPDICEQRDCGCEIGSDSQFTGNWLCKQSNGTETSVPAPTLCPQRKCACDKDANGDNTGEATCKYSDGHTEAFHVPSLCPKPGGACGDGTIQTGEDCETGIACTKAGDTCNLSNCKCEPQTSCGNGTIQAGEDCEPGVVACADPTYTCDSVCKCEPPQSCANTPGAQCTVPGAACTTATGAGICTTDCRCVPGPSCQCVTDTQGNNTGYQVCGNAAPTYQPNLCPPPARDCNCNVVNGAWDGSKICTDGTVLPGPFPDCPAPSCGNNAKESPPEECDPPGSACDANHTCSASCTCERNPPDQPKCGNGVIEAGEACEPPGSQCPSTTASLVCNTKCQCVVK